MAITRAQQARQMLKKGTEPVVQGGVDNYLGKQPQVVAPRKWQSGPDKPPTELAYITEAEKKLLLKEDIHGSLKKGPNQGPAGIISLDSFGDAGGAGAAGGDTEAGGGAMEGRGFSGRGPSETRSAFDARVRNQKEIMQKAEQRQARNLGIRERKNIIDMRRPGRLGRGLGFNPLSTLLGFINPALGLAARGVMSVPRTFDKFKSSQNLAEFFNKVRGPKDITTDEDDTTLLDQVSPDLPFARSYLNQLQSKMPTNLNDYQGLTNLNFINRVNESDMSLTPEQQQLIEEEQFGDVMAADGGMIGGGVMDAAGRQGYFLGKAVKKIGRAVKKVVKSPVGKIGLGALALKTTGLGSIIKKSLLPKLISGGKLTGLGKFGLGALLSSAPFFMGQEEDEGQQVASMGSVGGQIDPRAYTDPRSVLFPAFKMADGGPMDEKMNELLKAFETYKKMGGTLSYEDFSKIFATENFAEGGDVEPVAKKTMPLLDMGGQEMDLRAEGGFVPIGRMEKADDVPARLSKNEFVFTAEAVRNAGEGDVDKGAEVMYNMMKNLEAGGDVSEDITGTFCR